MEQKTELTDEQIQQLFAFCNKHAVQYYDLQVELVDHLADAITAEMSKKGSKLSFEDALQNVYTSFGKKGFAPIVQTKEKELNTWAAKQKWALFKAYFTWPKAALTTLLITVFALLPKLLPFNWLRGAFAVIMIVFITVEIVAFFRIKKLVKQQQQNLLIIKKGQQRTYLFTSAFGGIINGLNGLDCLGWLKKPAAFSLAKFYLLSGTFVLIFIISLAVINFSFNLFTLARKQYPAAFKTVA